VGVLEIKANQFRLKAIPLTQVRSFIMGELSLQDQHKSLDPEDPKIDVKMTKILEDEVRTLVFEAREKRKTLLRDAAVEGNPIAHDEDALKYKLEKPDEVIIRLKVEHTGFSTLNNQRFGARFVGDVVRTVIQI
jgi:double-strand break repair protein MRE11